MFNKKGFTLVEILLVVVIIGILAAFIAIPRFMNAANQARDNACKANIANINSQLELYNINTGAYPASLDVILNNTAYFPDGAPQCPYGDAYVLGANNRVVSHFDANGNHI